MKKNILLEKAFKDLFYHLMPYQKEIVNDYLYQRIERERKQAENQTFRKVSYEVNITPQTLKKWVKNRQDYLRSKEIKEL